MPSIILLLLFVIILLSFLASPVFCCDANHMMQEYEQLMKENDLLEQKLHMQEDDFRLQNEALMKELAQVL